VKVAHVIAIARKQFLVLKHDPRTLALMLVAPIMAMLIFGFAFGSSPKHIAVAVVNEDASGLASGFIDNLDHEKLNITMAGDAESARQDVRDGKIVGALIFPPVSAKGARVELFLDTTNQQLAGVIPPELARAAQKFAAEHNAGSPIGFDTKYAFPEAKNARYIDYFVPGVMAFAITLFTTLLTLLAFVGERTSGTLDRLRVTPVTETEIVLGYELAFGIIAAIQGFLILLVALLVYHILIVGPILLAVLLVILVAIDAQAVGILVSAAAKREGQAVQFIPFIVFPTFLLSGIFVAVASLPGWLRPFSYALPPTWGIAGLRDVMLRGWGLEHVWPTVAILAGFACVFTMLAIVGLKRARS
jgi:ABC-2 type transport system permease protein